jgi:hypothetical protein
MDSNNLPNSNKGGIALNIKTVLRVLSLICIVCFFLPTFMVSCSGQSVNVSMLGLTKGIKYQGEQVADASPIMIIALLIPVIIFAVLMMAKMTEHKASIISLVLSAIDIVLWVATKAAVYDYADQNYCTAETTGWYTVNLIALIAIAVLALLVTINILHMESGHVVSGGAAQNIAGTAPVQRPDNIIGYCPNCGKPIEKGYKFCMSCGTPVDEQNQ